MKRLVREKERPGDAEDWRLDGGIPHREWRVLKAALTPAERSMTTDHGATCQVRTAPRARIHERST